MLDITTELPRARGRDGDWTEPRTELLKSLFADGRSASQIATEIGGVTRNAVIGKLSRLGLAGYMPDTWTAEREAQLLELWIKGLSFTIMAVKLGLSRNTVLGKAKRLKLSETHPRVRLSSASHRPRRKSQVSSVQGLTRAERAQKQRARNGTLPPLVIVEAPMPAEFLSLTFDDLRPFSIRNPNQCRYPLGAGADIRFCGQPTPAGKPYCRHCLAICTNPQWRRSA